jgi:hypothetical protein
MEDIPMTIGATATPTPGSTLLWVFALAVSMAGMACVTARAAETKVPVVFSGGHETDSQDRGRPVFWSLRHWA